MTDWYEKLRRRKEIQGVDSNVQVDRRTNVQRLKVYANDSIEAKSRNETEQNIKPPQHSSIRLGKQQKTRFYPTYKDKQRTLEVNIATSVS